MKLKELLETVHELTDKIGRVRANVDFCAECKKGTTQEEHSEKHLEEAMEIRAKLPHNLVWTIESLGIKPVIKLTIDEEGHVIANLEEVEID
jgi:hypothetical protein